MENGVLINLGDLVRCEKRCLLGQLSSSFEKIGFRELKTTQIQVWENEIEYLQATGEKLLQYDVAFAKWHFLLEYEIPRRQKRPDSILLNGNILFVIEFKLGTTRPGSQERWQIEEYALDLRDFHAASHDKVIFPILCLDEGFDLSEQRTRQTIERYQSVYLCNVSSLAEQIIQLYGEARRGPLETIDAEKWRQSPYRPTLTIIEAAERLFSQHSVREISHSYAQNLTETSEALIEHIKTAQQIGDRRICFVTGVPGAGKTLTGLNAVHDPQLRREGRVPAVFLSGNGPLVKIIRAALVKSCQRSGKNRRTAKREVGTFIQNVHTFLKQYQGERIPPTENVIVFDEAQRAWNARKMKSKYGISFSEPEIVLNIMERCVDWCVIIALVGGGQEIHEGEAGLGEWGEALSRRSQKWTVVASEEALSGGHSVSGQRLFVECPKVSSSIKRDARMHLDVSTRSWRAQKYNEWVNYLLAMNCEMASKGISELQEFPITMTRDLNVAKRWLKERSRLEINRRCGLVASSGAIRLRAYGLELSTGFRQNFPYEEWFLAGPNDIRSSYRLEVAATEFEIQGLELDWVGVCWGNDLTLGSNAGWRYRRFTGTKWSEVRSYEKCNYILNKYRVLLTRARQGIIIWIPEGHLGDTTLEPHDFDSVYKYLLRCGVSETE